MATSLVSREYKLWHYTPSVPAAAIFAVIFGILTLAHGWKLARSRMWFCLPFVIGGVLESIGYVARIISSSNLTSVTTYALQSVLLLVPPSLFAASLYMVLGRTISGLGQKAEHLSIIRVNWLTKIFVLGDVFSFLVQSAGAGLLTSGNNQSLGRNVIIAGLILQVVFFGLFVVAAVVFHRRWDGTAESIAAGNGWKKMLYMLYGTSVLILVRSVFRIIEYAEGMEGYLMTHEWMLYVFDSVLMAAVMLAFFIWYPDEIRRYRMAAASSAHASADNVELGMREDTQSRRGEMRVERRYGD